MQKFAKGADFFTPEITSKNSHESVVVEKRKNSTGLPLIPSSYNINAEWAGENPFTLKLDNEWMDLCQREKHRAKKERRKERNKKYYEKDTFKSRYTGSTLPFIKDYFQELDDEMTKEQAEITRLAELKNAISSTSKKCRVRTVEKEFTHELVQRKREMFLVNYSITTKRDEIQQYKIKEKTAERKIREKAETLHEDAVLFDDFLKATDEAAVEAMKVAEHETKLKLEKISEYRQMQAQMGVIKTKTSRKDEILADYYSYKSFLLQVNYNKIHGTFMVTEQWREKLAEDREIRLNKESHLPKQVYHNAAKKLKRRPSYLAKKFCNELVYDQKRKQEGEYALERTASKVTISKQMFPEEWHNPDISEKQTNEIMWLLDNPKKFANIMHNLEEENLKLIYHFQHSEETLEDKRYACEEAEYRLNAETEMLKSQVETMAQYINSFETRTSELEVMCRILDEGARENGDQALEDLNYQIEKVYRTVVGRLIVNIDGLIMLTCIENKMEQLMEEIDTLPESAVKEVQKMKDKERRHVIREEKLMIQRHKQEERARRAQERSNARSFRKIGRKLVFRSEPIRTRGKTRRATEGIIQSDSTLFFDNE